MTPDETEEQSAQPGIPLTDVMRNLGFLSRIAENALEFSETFPGMHPLDVLLETLADLALLAANLLEGGQYEQALNPELVSETRLTGELDELGNERLRWKPFHRKFTHDPEMAKAFRQLASAVIKIKQNPGQEMPQDLIQIQGSQLEGNRLQNLKRFQQQARKEKISLRRRAAEIRKKDRRLAWKRRHSKGT